MDPAPAGQGAVVEVRFADGVWYRGRLVKRIIGAKPPRWRVRFDDGEVRDDICLDSAHTPVRFDAATCYAAVEMQYDGSWYRGRLVELSRIKLRQRRVTVLIEACTEQSRTGAHRSPTTL